MEVDWCWCEARPSGGQHSEDGCPLSLFFAFAQQQAGQACQIELCQRSTPRPESRDERATEHSRSPYQAVPAPIFPRPSIFPSLSPSSQVAPWNSLSGHIDVTPRALGSFAISRHCLPLYRSRRPLSALAVSGSSLLRSIRGPTAFAIATSESTSILPRFLFSPHPT